MKDRFIIAIVFIAVFLGHSTNKTVIHSDSMWVLPATVSIVQQGNIDLDEYKQMIEENNYFGVDKVNGHFYNSYPIGTSLVALPLIFVAKLVCNIFAIDLFRLILYKSPMRSECYIASIIVALTACILYLVGRNAGSSKWQSLLVAFIFSFCTSAWSTATRSLWQHGPSMLMLSVSLYLIIKAKVNPKLIQFVGFPLAFSYLIRPTNSIAVALLSLYVIMYYRRFILGYLISACIVLIPFVIFNVVIYHSVLSPYYFPSKLGSNPHFIEALLGNLVSPARGLFIFSPILIMSLWGIYIKHRKHIFEKLDYYLLGIMVLHWITISSFLNWWGGHSYGPRFFTDILPFFAYYLFPVFAEIPRLEPKRRALAYSISFVIAMFSFWVQARAANCLEVHWWNMKPTNIDKDPKRLWDWKDIQFLRQ
jgi:hypothetical protein